MNGWDVLNTLVSGFIGAGGALFVGRLSRRDQVQDRNRALIESVFELVERTHADVMGELAIAVTSDEDLDPEALAAYREKHLDRFAQVGISLGIIRSKLLLLHSDAASTEFNNYAQLVVTSMERATAGQVTKQQLANEVVPQLRGHLAGIQQALSQIKA